MSSSPIAYLITVGTYGSRLHGDERGTVDRDQNAPGEPFLGTDPARQHFERDLMVSGVVRLSASQQEFVESTVPRISDELGWACHVVSAASNHIHALISADAPGAVVRRLLKRRMSQALSHRWPTHAPRSWRVEGGSVKWLWNDTAFRQAGQYIAEQRRAERAEPRR